VAEVEPDRLRRALTKALSGADADFRRHGRWGDLHRLQLAHIFGRIPCLGRAYRFVDDPVGGGNDSVMKTAHGVRRTRHRVRLGAIARHLSDPNWFVLLGGQDGWLGSQSFVDQYALWRRGAAIQVPLDPAAALRSFTTTMTLAPVDRQSPLLAAE
jgi:penicillin G amidase